ncbi:MAG: tyramine oxidase subunit B [Wujia sp.]
MNTQIDFLFLSEEDMLEAGVTDMDRCIASMEDMFSLLGKGDYRMGSKNSNSHGIMVDFPDDPPFPNMPKNGPDRRYMAMPAYLGGRFDIVGNKWYGSNKENCEKGLPRSILTLMLNDKDTGAPVALMSANILSSMRTGAVPGVAAKYLAGKNAKVLGIIGPGVVNKSSAAAMLSACPSIDTLKICGRRRVTSENMEQYLRERYPQIRRVEIVETHEEAVRDADVITIATSGAAQDPYIRAEWIKPGAFFNLPASIHFDDSFLQENRVRHVVDNWLMYESWKDEFGYPLYKAIDEMACYYEDMIHDGTLDPDRIIELGDIINGEIPARNDPDDIVLFTTGGMPVEDVAWGYDLYQTAMEKGLGTKLTLWKEPHMI